ncbi:hypothetical protein [Streptomyces sp. NPDC047043]|uniref:hypothetical protein n=1 Tax=Streptomyces sp. NPDC047043 TaxID=3154497 RepID=UPI0033D59AA5
MRHADREEKAHAQSMAGIIYASAWAKYHFPHAMLAGIMAHLPMGFYDSQTLIQDAKQHGIASWNATPLLVAARKARRLRLVTAFLPVPHVPTGHPVRPAATATTLATGPAGHGQPVDLASAPRASHPVRSARPVR